MIDWKKVNPYPSELVNTCLIDGQCGDLQRLTADLAASGTSEENIKLIEDKTRIVCADLGHCSLSVSGIKGNVNA